MPWRVGIETAFFGVVYTTSTCTNPGWETYKLDSWLIQPNEGVGVHVLILEKPPLCQAVEKHIPPSKILSKTSHHRTPRYVAACLWTTKLKNTKETSLLKDVAASAADIEKFLTLSASRSFAWPQAGFSPFPFPRSAAVTGKRQPPHACMLGKCGWISAAGAETTSATDSPAATRNSHSLSHSPRPSSRTPKAWPVPFDKDHVG